MPWGAGGKREDFFNTPAPCKKIIIDLTTSLKGRGWGMGFKITYSF
jgi:hypothetical protein